MGAFKDMTKSNLIEILSAKQPLLNDRDVELAVRQIIKSGNQIIFRNSGQGNPVERKSRSMRSKTTTVGTPVEMFLVALPGGQA